MIKNIDNKLGSTSRTVPRWAIFFFFFFFFKRQETYRARFAAFPIPYTGFWTSCASFGATELISSSCIKQK
jgi:hypothetical protein